MLGQIGDVLALNTDCAAVLKTLVILLTASILLPLSAHPVGQGKKLTLDPRLYPC
jgi:hypothetical protein